MNVFAIDLKQIKKTDTALVGGKAANLGELTTVAGIRTSPGFCVTTTAYKLALGTNPDLKLLLTELASIGADDRNEIVKVSAAIRHIIENALIPAAVVSEVKQQLERYDPNTAFAVRSSATAEDLLTASFAGQQDTYLNITGTDNVLKHISKCWASLFTERAVIYRMQNGFGNTEVQLAVIVQQMVIPKASGIMFTADPLTSNRKVVSIDAGFGLGEALVSGLVNADNYKVRESEIIDRNISAKKLAIRPLPTGGTGEQSIPASLQLQQVLTNEQILQLAHTGRVIERHFGSPQDIEWCLASGDFYIVQSRPITTLFPIPDTGNDAKHVFVSVGHQQMMTDAMKPLGLAVFRLNVMRPMYIAGGRLFVDVAENLATAAGRHMLINVLGKSDPLVKKALQTIVERNFIADKPADDSKPGGPAVLPPQANRAEIENDEGIVQELIGMNERSLKKLKSDIAKHSGAGLFDFILNDIEELKKVAFAPRSTAMIMAGMDAVSWLNEKMNEWLGEKNAADVLSQSVPHNITSEMGLALLDVADVIRPYPEIIEFLQHNADDDFLHHTPNLTGAKECYEAIIKFLDKYGMRCAGEIDITKPRWSEEPLTLLPLILNNIKNFTPGESKRKFEQGLKTAEEKKHDLLKRLRQLPDGENKATDALHKIGVLRRLVGYREYPKYGIISRYFVYKQALMKEARKLVAAGAIGVAGDVFYLDFEEFRQAVHTGQANRQLIDQRKQEHLYNEKLKPPRVMTSEGEVINGSYSGHALPAGAIAGLAVSSGIVEGRARVILNMKHADIGEGDILVTTFTDPSWTPLFVSVKGLVTEVGGLMTHGAVIAREYGLPAVVGIENATRLIKDGQHIRINGTDGYVQIL